MYWSLIFFRNCKKDKRKGKTDVGKKGKHIFNN